MKQPPPVHCRSLREVACVPTSGRDLEELLDREWLLTNERGSYSAASIVGCNTSGYHGLLIGSPEPLVNRIMALSNCLEVVRWGRQVAELSTFEFPGRFAPTGYTFLREFRLDTGARFLFGLEPADLTKAVYLARDSDTVVVEYAFEEVREPFDFSLRPFIALRDFHLLQNSQASLICESLDGVLSVRHNASASHVLKVGCPGLRFERDPQWWFNFLYRANRTRGLNYQEDLWTPGWFRGRVRQPGRIVFWARLTDGGMAGGALPPDVEVIKADLLRRQEQLVERGTASVSNWSWHAERGNGPAGRAAPDNGIDTGAEGDEEAGFYAPMEVLCRAVDQFIVRRRHGAGRRTTIVAGYPWFADWGRDTFISLPGLLLATGRSEEAAAVLRTFAAAVDEGMVPNYFDDRTGGAYFNSVDASLWFVQAAFGYLDTTGDTEMFLRELVPAIEQILDAYHRGTRFGIHADADGLIMAGDDDTQLTWMDAKCDGIAFTPRYGKAVEVNALWHNALRRMENFEARTRNRKSQISNLEYGTLAEQVGYSFGKLFWNEQRGYLNDVVLPDGAVDASLRPNQIFAVSLPYGPPLTRARQQAVVQAVERELLTPYGLRTLNRQDTSYHGRCEGSPRSRDEAYHQGTVWPFLMGPFVEAYLRVHDGSPQARARAAGLLDPLLHHLVEDACLGSVSEIFDGDPPHTPRGCPAQAWSVAELIRACRLIAG